MKTKLCVLIFLLAAALARAQTNSLTALLQQGLFEEQANRNLDAAIADYSSLATQFDKDRQLASTAVFRLGECYRMQGKTNEATTQYQRILRDFSDQTTLVTLSQQNLTGMDFTQADGSKTTRDSAEASAEARSLAAQISGIERLNSVQEQGLAVQAIFPDETLKKMLLQLPKLQEQETMLKTNPQMTYDQLTRTQGYAIAVGDGGFWIRRDLEPMWKCTAPIYSPMPNGS
jgi:tetratricopeptide (TPR) repeat protein